MKVLHGFQIFGPKINLSFSSMFLRSWKGVCMYVCMYVYEKQAERDRQNSCCFIFQMPKIDPRLGATARKVGPSPGLPLGGRKLATWAICGPSPGLHEHKTKIGNTPRYHIQAPSLASQLLSEHRPLCELLEVFLHTLTFCVMWGFVLELFYCLGLLA